MDAERVYYGCVRAFSRMLSYGETSVMVSFYCHNRRGNELDRAVIKAAKDVGIRLFFGRMNYDIITEGAYKEKQDSQRSYFESPQEAEKLPRTALRRVRYGENRPSAPQLSRQHHRGDS